MGSALAFDGNALGGDGHVQGRRDEGGRREIRTHYAQRAMVAVLMWQRRIGMETRLRADEARDRLRAEVRLRDERPQRAERDGERGKGGKEAFSRLHGSDSIATV